MLVNLLLFVAGFGALVWAYLPFSPMTRDLVAFLSRDQQIRIFKYRKVYWSAGFLLLAALLVRIALGIEEPNSSGALASGAAALGEAHWLWLIPLLGLGTLMAFLYWAMYVPIVMAPPKDHRLVDREAADAIMEPDSIVLGIELDGEVRAYPRDLIARPHWFNDEIGGRPLMISYCILCNSGQAFVPLLADGRRLDLRNMTAFDNNTIYHCTRTGNYIQQLDGRVISGPNEGEQLESFPVVMARWEEWKRLHPDTKLYFAPPHTFRDRFTQHMLMKMVPLWKLAARDKPWHVVRGDIDSRLPAMSFVFGAEVNGEYVAYAVTELAESRVVNDSVGGEPIVVLYDRDHDIGQIYYRRAGEQTLTFADATEEGAGRLMARDTETGSTWEVSGHAIDGPLKGETLAPAPHWNQLFWFSWAAFKPGTRVHGA